MKFRVAFLLALLLAVTATDVVASKIKGNGNIVTREVKVSEFEQIEIGSGISTEGNIWVGAKRESPAFRYTQTSGSASLEITIDENLFPLLDISSSNGRLVIKAKKNNDKLLPSRFIAKASSRTLERVSTSGAIDFHIDGRYTGDELQMKISGACDVFLRDPVQVSRCEITVSGAGDIVADELYCGSISCRVSGAGDASLKGKAEEGEFHVSGSGDIKAYDFIVNSLECHVSGAGDIKAYASKYIKAHASGSGDVRYKGDAEAETGRSGAGSVKHVR